MKNLSSKIGEMEFDGLVTDIVPAVQVRGGIVAGLGAKTVLKRGTVLAKSTASGKLYVLGSASPNDLTADCILCDDTEVDTTDAKVMVYTAGCFDINKATVADGHTITEAEKDKLRERGIVFKAAMSY